VSRLEDPDYGRLTIETLLEVASKLDIALLVRFVDHATFLMATNDFSEDALRPQPYNQAVINTLASQPTLQAQYPAGSFATGITLSLPAAWPTINASPHSWLVEAPVHSNSLPDYSAATEWPLGNTGTVAILPAIILQDQSDSRHG
jgi:hypothetical protein